MPDFQKIRKLNSGHFGDVWLVNDNAVGQERAVKYVRELPPGATPTDVYLEPQVLTKLASDYIVAVKDAGMEDGVLYIAMEFVSDGSYQDELDKDDTIAMRTARDAICDVCRALEYAHSLSYIHRDIKPANILRGKKNSKLSDFGLAVPNQSASAFGYLTHLAPEAFTENRTDKLTDIYAAGVTLYRMVNGNTDFNFQQQKIKDLMTSVTKGQFPSRNRYQPFLPKLLKNAINKAMSVDPSRRYQSAQQFRAALEKARIKCDWRVSESEAAITYSGYCGTTKYVATVAKQTNKKGCYEFILTKKIQGKSVRRMTDCASSKRKLEIDRHVRTVLSRISETGK